MEKSGFFVSELSTSTHVFCNYHFCRGNSNKRKTRLGVIRKGSGAYLYLNKRLVVKEGDLVFIPENIYCYSEWRGTPEIEVVYVSCFMHYDGLHYEPQIILCEEEVKERLLETASLLRAEGQTEGLEAYSLFYKLLQTILPQMKPGNIAFDKTLQTAVEYITDNWDKPFSIADVAKKCCVSESTLYHLFQRELGQTPLRFLQSIRINVAIEYLENTSCSVSAVSRKVGFPSENHFRKVFFDFVGTTPARFRKNGGEK